MKKSETIFVNAIEFCTFIAIFGWIMFIVETFFPLGDFIAKFGSFYVFMGWIVGGITTIMSILWGGYGIYVLGNKLNVKE